MENSLSKDKEVVTSSFCDDVLGTLDATALSKLIKSGSVSVDEVQKASLDRANQVNPRLNAIADSWIDRKEIVVPNTADGVFSGVPSYIKDTDDFVGLKTSNGTRAYQSVPSTKNSKFVNQYLSLGMQILGKSTLPEFGLCSVTESSASGDTCNPWNKAYSPGGSSGGAGALVAAGVVPIAHGNDAGGSLRTPASCCGLVSLKSSRGRVLGIEGKLPLDLTCQGVLTRSVRDTANFHYGAELYYANGNLPEIGLVTHAGHKRLKIAVFTDNAKNEKADSACAEATFEAARLCEKLGHYVDFISCPYPQEIFDDLELYFGSLAFAISKLARFTVPGKWDSSKLEKYTTGLEGVFKRNFIKYPFALSRLRKYQYTYEKIFDNCDVLMSPTNGTTPPKIGFMGPNQPFDVAVDRLKRHSAFTVFQNISGSPAISLPLGMSKNNLPVGIQFASAYGQEKMLLELAFELEEAQPRFCLSEFNTA
jgi:amidase